MDSEEESYTYEYDDDPGYEFDFHRIGDPIDYGDLNLRDELELSLQDESQALHHTLSPPSESDVFIPAEDNPNIIYSESILSSRKFLSEVFGVDTSNFKRFHVPGLIVLRIEDFALLRNDSRSSRVVPHILINGDRQALIDHPDFITCLDKLQPK